MKYISNELITNVWFRGLLSSCLSLSLSLFSLSSLSLLSLLSLSLSPLSLSLLSLSLSPSPPSLSLSLSRTLALRFNVKNIYFLILFSMDFYLVFVITVSNITSRYNGVSAEFKLSIHLKNWVQNSQTWLWDHTRIARTYFQWFFNGFWMIFV